MFYDFFHLSKADCCEIVSTLSTEETSEIESVTLNTPSKVAIMDKTQTKYKKKTLSTSKNNDKYLSSKKAKVKAMKYTKLSLESSKLLEMFFPFLFQDIMVVPASKSLISSLRVKFNGAEDKLLVLGKTN